MLRDCSLTVAPGEKVALVGVSGAGKSTVIQLMARSYDVTQGTVRIGGRDVRELDYEDLLDHISLVFQKTFFDPGKRAGKHSHELGSNTGAGARAARNWRRSMNFIQSLPRARNQGG